MPQKLLPNTSSVKILVPILIIWAVILGSYIGVRYYFKVKVIQIIEKDPGKSKWQLHGFETLSNYNLILSDKNSEINYLKRSNPIIRSITLDETFPDKIVLILNFYIPVAALKGDRGYFLISSDGSVLSQIANPDPKLPQITFYQNFDMSSYQPGSTFEFGDIKTALLFLQSAIDLGLKTSKIEISGSDMIALYADQEKIIFNQEKDIATQKYQFETIVRDFKSQGKTFKSLDVRFDKPVVVF